MSVTASCAPVFILLFALLLAFPKYAIDGASDGLLLWFHTVIPALAPAMICSRMILANGGVRILMRPFAPLFRRIFSLSETGSFILLSGMLCGYPLGPALCTQALEKHQISPKEASYLLAICSYPSPMFLLGYVRQQLDSAPTGSSYLVWLLLTGIYAPVFLLSLAARIQFCMLPGTFCPELYSEMKKAGIPECQKPRGNSSTSDSAPHQAPVTLDECLYSTCDTMVLIGGYLMLFSILSCFLNHAAWIPAPIAAALCGITEMTTGIRQICRVFPRSIQLPACAASAAFGGISGVFQVRSVMQIQDVSTECSSGSSSHRQTDPSQKSLLYNNKNAGYDIRHYVGWKLLHAGLSAMILTVLPQVPLLLQAPRRW